MTLIALWKQLAQTQRVKEAKVCHIYLYSDDRDNLISLCEAWEGRFGSDKIHALFNASMSRDDAIVVNVLSGEHDPSCRKCLDITRPENRVELAWYTWSEIR